MTACADHRPLVRLAEQSIRRLLHERDVVGMRADAAADAEHRLNEQRRRQQPAIDEMRGGVEMSDVVALYLEAGAVGSTGAENAGDVAERVLEHAGFAASQIRRLPFV